MLEDLLVLLGFGIIHAFLIWYGDILITYAIMGLVLLLFLRISWLSTNWHYWSCYILLPQLFMVDCLF